MYVVQGMVVTPWARLVNAATSQMKMQHPATMSPASRSTLHTHPPAVQTKKIFFLWAWKKVFCKYLDFFLPLMREGLEDNFPDVFQDLI